MVDIDRTSHRSPLHKARPGGAPPSAIVIHSGEGTLDGDIATLTGRDTGVSSNYYVTRAGKVFQFVDDNRQSQHAGASRYLGRRRWNEFSLGIETQHREGQNWPDAQKTALAELCAKLIDDFGILREMVVAHRWIAVPRERRSDPSNFPDSKLRPFILDCFPGKGGRMFRVNTKAANVRSGPGRNHGAIAVLEPGDVIEVSDVVAGSAVNGNADWMKRVSGGGFIHSSLVDELAI